MKKFFTTSWMISAITVAVGAFLIYLLVHFEQGGYSEINSYGDACWYVLVTITSVGYGDIVPTSVGGKLIGIIFVLASLGVVGLLIGNITTKLNKYMEKKKLGSYGTNFSKHVIIVGWDDFGRMVADQISRAGHKVAIVTENQEDIDHIYNQLGKNDTFVLFSKYSSLEMLKKLNIQDAGAIFLNLGDDTETLVYYLNNKAAIGQTKCVVSLNNPNLKPTFKAAGIVSSVSKNDLASKMVASSIFEPDVAMLTEDLMSSSMNEFDYDMQQYQVLVGNRYVGETFMSVFVDMKERFNAIIIGVSRFKNDAYQLVYNPKPRMKINANDYFIVIANGLGKLKIENEFKVKEGKF